MVNLNQSHADFLQRCEVSSQNTYEAFKSLLAYLQNSASTGPAIRLLNALCDAYEVESDQDAFLKRYNFSFHQVELGGQVIKLLQLPSIFAPEEWSFTFYEGLARFPASYFTDKVVTELGCGNGWITISLARNSPLKKIYGLDINPRAVNCAWINLYFNAHDRNGELLLDEFQRNLLERVEFAESDLLGFILDRHIILDRVIGCIPQVLSPNPEIIIKSASQLATDQDLYDLSNYYSMQGYVEDQFGLGLIARALEESVRCIRPGGSIVLNLGGRPGVGVLERLFKRRGLQVRRIWSTRVPQAADTDIGPLVEIEENSQHRFEFFIGINAKEPIDARCAQAYARAGGEIAHALSVYEATIPSHEEVKNILSFLQNAAYTDVRAALDLSADSAAIYEERVHFLSALAQRFAGTDQLPYEETQGKTRLRERMAQFIQSYFRVPLTKDHILIAPSRHDIIANVLSLYRPRLALIDKALCQGMNPEWIARHQKVSGTRILEAPRKGELVRELIRTLKPDLAITSLSAHENESSESFAQLIAASKQYNCQLIVDISDFFDLSSSPQTNAALSYMVHHSLPQHVSLICGLVKNLVYRDLHICFVLSENPELLEHLNAAAEFTYSRTPLLSQEYYEIILNDLLSFHLIYARSQSERVQRRPDMDVSTPLLCSEARQALEHPSIKRSSIPITAETVRLDYGENCFAVPTPLRVGIFESFSRKDLNDQEASPTAEILSFLEDSLGLADAKNHMLVYGSGLAPLYSGLVMDCVQNEGTFIFPRGCYGEFVATALFFGARHSIHPTQEKDSFKFTPASLHAALQGKSRAYIFLNAPVVNPSGAVYTKSELAEIAEVAKAHHARLIVDMAFMGLEFEAEKQWLKSLPQNGLQWAVLASASKQFAAGGLRFGFALTNSMGLKQALQTGNVRQPHFTVLYAMKKLYRDLNQNQPEIIAALSHQRMLLKKRADRLCEVLRETGWSPVPPAGGLFIIARPVRLLGRHVQLPEGQVTIDGSNIADLLMRTTGLLINSSEWTGIPEYCRFVLSVSEEDFEKAILALKEFTGRYVEKT